MRAIIRGGLVAVAVVILVAALLALPTMWLWNWIVPQVFPGPVNSGALLGHLGFFQALGLTLLTTILVRPFPGSRK
jgi:hypothetical protein